MARRPMGGTTAGSTTTSASSRPPSIPVRANTASGGTRRPTEPARSTRDPQLAARYRRLMCDTGRHHTSATCTVVAVFLTRIESCLRNGTHYELRDVDGTPSPPTTPSHHRPALSNPTGSLRRSPFHLEGLQPRGGTSGPRKESLSAPDTARPHTTMKPLGALTTIGTIGTVDF